MTRGFPAAALLAAAIVFAIDQAIKYWITGVLHLDDVGGVRTVTSFYQFTFVPNCGISLGLLGHYSDTHWARVALTAVTSGIALAVLVWLWRERNGADRLALGCIFGGAMGNIVDRLIPAGTLGKLASGAVAYPGCVIDYADLHIGGWRPFLVFNVADAAITLGVLVLLGRALLGGRRVQESSNA